MALLFETRRIQEGKREPWPMFAQDMEEYVHIFGAEFPEVLTIADRLQARREKGESVLVVDLCGLADGHSIGADHTIGVTLKKWPHLHESSTQTIVEGDIFASGTIEKIIAAIQRHGGIFHCLFFDPKANLQQHGDLMRSHLRLYSALQKLYPCAADGAELYLKIHSFVGAHLLPDVLALQSEHIYCEMGDPNHTRRHGFDLFRIVKKTGAPANIASIRELQKIPGLTERFEGFFNPPSAKTES